MSNSIRVVITCVLILFAVIGVAFILLIPVGKSAIRRNPVASRVDTNIFGGEKNTTQPMKAETTPIRLLFGGDMMFDRSIRTVADKNTYQFILSELKTLFWSHDMVIANLEGPITSYQSESVGSVPGSSKNFIFTFDPEVAPVLKEHNIQVVNLGNNHILNFGQDGLEQTKTYLNKAAVSYFGNTGEDAAVGRTTVQTIQGVKIGLVNYNQFTTDSLNRAVLDITSLKDSVDVIIVYTHWGLEYQLEANQVIHDIATQLQTAGADLIIGSHPHVIQQHEDLVSSTGEVTRVYYSLGNFVFDQYFEDTVKKGLLVSVTIDPSTLKMQYQEMYVQLLPTGQTISLP